MTRSNLIAAIQKAFPQDKFSAIDSWVDLATQYGEPLTVSEYTEYRTVNGEA